MENYQELKERFLSIYEALLLLNQHVAETDFGHMAGDLMVSSPESILGYYDESDLQLAIDQIVEVVDIEVAKLGSYDPVEKGFLFANQLVTL